MWNSEERQYLANLWPLLLATQRSFIRRQNRPETTSLIPRTTRPLAWRMLLEVVVVPRQAPDRLLPIAIRVRRLPPIRITAVLRSRTVIFPMVIKLAIMAPRPRGILGKMFLRWRMA